MAAVQIAPGAQDALDVPAHVQDAVEDVLLRVQDVPELVKETAALLAVLRAQEQVIVQYHLEMKEF